MWFTCSATSEAAVSIRACSPTYSSFRSGCAPITSATGARCGSKTPNDLSICTSRSSAPLAIVREPVPISRLAEWSERFTPTKRALSPSQVLDVIRRWRQFLNEDRSQRVIEPYRVYHASFQDFLKEEVDLTRYDNAIVDIALAKVPGFLSSP